MRNLQRHSTSDRFFFFFQAEDGIRDYKVTGVQTCALPISIPIHSGYLPECTVRIIKLLLPNFLRLWGRTQDANHTLSGYFHALRLQNLRSEERRVGKECRSRWSPYH